MTEGACTFAIEVRRADGALAGTADASVSMCVEDALFRGVQAGHLANDGQLPALRLTPTWHEAQRPSVAALSLRLEGVPTRHYDREVFAVQARALVQRLLREKKISDGEKVQWQVVAREEDADAARPRARTTRAPFPWEPEALPQVPRGGFEVRFEAGVLRKLHDRVRASGETEGAELLLGRLAHDSARQALELRIVDALPLAAGRGGRSNVHFAFDPGSFVSARRAAEARGDGVRPVGWHHNHNPCAGCRDNPECKVNWVFFSELDLEVHTSAFGSPAMVALVGGKVGHLPAQRPGFRLYGWRDARVVERPFRVEGSGAGVWSARDGAFLDEEDG
ncbi:MAG: hypothetical protein V3U03_00550 [Myxococcota bacterium]